MADPGFPIVVVGGVPVVQPPLQIDAANAGWLRQALVQAASGGQATVVVNLTATRSCDAAGLQVLVRAYQRAVAEGGRLLLVIPARAAVRQIFELTGADLLIPISAELAEALDQASAVVPRSLQRRVQRGFIQGGAAYRACRPVTAGKAYPALRRVAGYLRSKHWPGWGKNNGNPHSGNAQL